MRWIHIFTTQHTHTFDSSIQSWSSSCGGISDVYCVIHVYDSLALGSFSSSQLTTISRSRDWMWKENTHKTMREVQEFPDYCHLKDITGELELTNRVKRQNNIFLNYNTYRYCQTKTSSTFLLWCRYDIYSTLARFTKTSASFVTHFRHHFTCGTTVVPLKNMTSKDNIRLDCI